MALKFQVPQFVEVEDKIFWKLTLKQFIYLAGGGGVCVIMYLIVKPLILALLLMAPFVALAVALAFYRVNERPFIFVLESASKYLFNPRLYIWRKGEPAQSPEPVKEEEDISSLTYTPQLSKSRLKELTWSLDTKEATNPITRGDMTE